MSVGFIEISDFARIIKIIVIAQFDIIFRHDKAFEVILIFTNDSNGTVRGVEDNAIRRVEIYDNRLEFADVFICRVIIRINAVSFGTVIEDDNGAITCVVIGLIEIEDYLVDGV